MGGKKHKKASSPSAAPVLTILRRPDRQSGQGISIAASSNHAASQNKHRCFTCDAPFPNVNLLQIHVKSHIECNTSSHASDGGRSRKASSSMARAQMNEYTYKGRAAPMFVKATELTTSAIAKIEGVSSIASSGNSKGKQRAIEDDLYMQVDVVEAPLARATSRESTASSAAGWYTASSETHADRPGRTPSRYLQNYSSPSQEPTQRPITPSESESESGESESIASSTDEVLYRPVVSISREQSLGMHTPQRSISSAGPSTASTVRQMPLAQATATASPLGVFGLPLSVAPQAGSQISSNQPVGVFGLPLLNSPRKAPEPLAVQRITSPIGVFGLPLPDSPSKNTQPSSMQPDTNTMGLFGPPLPDSSSKITPNPSIAKRIPFVKPFTAFDMLERTIQALNMSPSAQSAPTLIQTQPVMPPSSVIPHAIAVPAPTAAIPGPLLSGKKIPRSPMQWGANDGRFTIDAPTLGSPTLGSMTDSYGFDSVEQKSGVEDVQYHPDIAKASHAVGKDDILAQLKERKLAKAQITSGASAPNGWKTGHYFQRQQVRSAHSAAPATRSKLAESDVPADRRAQNEPSTEGQQIAEKPAPDENGIVRQDMAESSATPPSSSDSHVVPSKSKSESETTPASEPASAFKTVSAPQADGKKPVSPVKKVQYAIDTVQETSATHGTLPVDIPGNAQGNGNTTGGMATTTTDEDTATDSDASGTSVLLRAVTQDVDDRSWDDAEKSAQQRGQSARRHLERAINELNRRHRSSPAVAKQRQDIIYALRRKLNGLLREYRHDFQYHLLPFGSSAYGLDTDRSDLDLCIIDPKRPDGFRSALDLYDIRADPTTDEPASTSDDEDETPSSPRPKRSISSTERKKRNNGTRAMPPPAELDAIYNVHRVAGILRSMRFREVHPIPSAGVPIVKFVSQHGIKADLNSNEQLGVRNSALLRAYVNFHPLVRPFLVFLKTWAKQRNLNDSAGMKGPISLSSYSLILMAIAYLQHARLVPNLQDLKHIKHANQPRAAFWTKIPNKDAKGRRRGRYLGDYKAMAVDTTFVRAMSPGSGWKCRFAQSESSSQDTQVVDLIEGFFEYYLGFPLEDQTVSIWNGAPLPRQQGFSGPTDAELSRTFEAEAVEEQEEEYQQQLQEESEELFHGADNQNDNNGRQTPSSTDEDEDEQREREEQSATLARIEAMLRAQGVKELEPSFQDRLKETKRLEKTQTPLATPPAIQNGHSRNGTPTPARSAPATLSNGSRLPARTGLDLDDADPQTLLFPFPEQEDPKDFVEPPIWTQKLIVQDPFIHTRNTCLNIQPDTVDRIIDEMHRALELLREGAQLQELCLSYKRDPDWRPVAGQRGRKMLKVERRAERREKRTQKRYARSDEYQLKKKLHNQEKKAERQYEAQLAAQSDARSAEKAKAGFPTST